MASRRSCLRCLRVLDTVASIPKPFILSTRAVSTTTYRKPPPYPPPYGAPYNPQLIRQRIKTYPPPPSIHKVCPEPLKTFQTSSLEALDPTGSRTRLFSRTNPDAAHVLDILLVRFRTGDPFSGVVMSIRRRGVDTAVLLRNHLTRVGTEMWVKVYSPTVTGMEIVQRTIKRARRARAYYLRKEGHDRGSLSGIVDDYLRRRSALRAGSIGEEGKSGQRGGRKGRK